MNAIIQRFSTDGLRPKMYQGTDSVFDRWGENYANANNEFNKCKMHFKNSNNNNYL